MKNNGINILLSFILIVCGFSSTAQTKDEAEIENISRKKFRWMIEQKLDSLDLLTDERLSYIHSNGWVQSKKEFLEDFKGKLIYHKIDINELSARVYRRSAVVTGKGHFSVSLNGNKLEIDLLFSEVYVRSGNKWKLVSRHANKIGT
ncbi:MAG: nuclear transport factor 2 family protein [Cyclobacteriaceae bacterium]